MADETIDTSPLQQAAAREAETAAAALESFDSEFWASLTDDQRRLINGLLRNAFCAGAVWEQQGLETDIFGNPKGSKGSN